jgi:Na+/melibiose symporter-like transporter
MKMEHHHNHPHHIVKKSVDIRTIVDPLLLVAFILTGATGILMFFHIHFSGMGELHKWAGNLFVLAGLVHLYPNFKLLLRQLKQRLGLVLLVLTLAVFGALTWYWANAVHEAPHGPMSVQTAR